MQKNLTVFISESGTSRPIDLKSRRNDGQVLHRFDVAQRVVSTVALAYARMKSEFQAIVELNNQLMRLSHGRYDIRLPPNLPNIDRKISDEDAELFIIFTSAHRQAKNKYMLIGKRMSH